MLLNPTGRRGDEDTSHNCSLLDIESTTTLIYDFHRINSFFSYVRSVSWRKTRGAEGYTSFLRVLMSRKRTGRQISLLVAPKPALDPSWSRHSAKRSWR